MAHCNSFNSIAIVSNPVPWPARVSSYPTAAALTALGLSVAAANAALGAALGKTIVYKLQKIVYKLHRIVHKLHRGACFQNKLQRGACFWSLLYQAPPHSNTTQNTT